MSLEVNTSDSGKATNSRLRGAVHSLLKHSSIRLVGPKGCLETVARSCGFDADELCVLNVLIRDIEASLVVIPGRTWRSTLQMHRYLKLISTYRDQGVDVRIVPGQFLSGGQAGEDRSTPCGRMRVEGEDLGRILAHLLVRRRSSISQIAASMRHHDPVNAILYLIEVGLLESDPNVLVAGSSPIFLPERLGCENGH